jgi:hypothetical protein
MRNLAMSAPQTNIEKQRRRHRGPLIGMALVVLFGVLLITWWLFEEASQAPDAIQSTVPAATATEGATGSQPASPPGG